MSVERKPARRFSGAAGFLVLLMVTSTPVAHAQSSVPGSAPESGELPAEGQRGYRGEHGPNTLFVPRIDHPPRLEDFESMRPPLEVRRQFAVVEDFTQRIPSDGEPARHPTRVYLGYDDDHLYAVFLAFDDQPEAIRARLSRREDIDSDDQVRITLDPFRAQQRGYEFAVNPRGIQRDGLWTEGGDGTDLSYDTLWHSEGRLTERGYVVSIAIPFRSLRFPREEIQTWGIVLARRVSRGQSEESYWPPVSNRVEGVLNQAGAITGLHDVSPGRNLRFIPYGTFRSFQALERGLPGGPDFVSDPADPAGGLDAKMVIADSMVVDATFNPDFSQVESDRPQNTVNRRFEVFFPEKRPFFLENANYFQTPINLLFTRRIADPQIGVRTTGKIGRWAVGALAIDDRAPGLRLDPGDVDHGERARVGTLRIARDVGEQNRIGAIWVDRDFAGGRNRVAGVDGRFKFDDNWIAEFQAVTTRTTDVDGSARSGPGYHLALGHTGRSLTYRAIYTDLDENFRAETGFVPRVGIRRLEQRFHYRIWTEGEVLQRWGPNAWFDVTWGRDGAVLDVTYNPWIGFRLPGRTDTGLFVVGHRTRLQPIDYPALQTDRVFDHRVVGFWLNTRFLRWLEINTWNQIGTRLNFVPATGGTPEVGPGREGQVELAVRPDDRARVGVGWLYSAVDEPVGDRRAFRSDIFRTRVDYQISRELSLRAIAQYEVVAADSRFTSLAADRNLNVDLLATYLINPWTSIFVGYNHNARNLELLTDSGVRTLRRTGGQLHPDARQLFMKVSYLLAY